MVVAFVGCCLVGGAGVIGFDEFDGLRVNCGLRYGFDDCTWVSL